MVRRLARSHKGYFGVSQMRRYAGVIISFDIQRDGRKRVWFNKRTSCTHNYNNNDNTNNNNTLLL